MTTTWAVITGAGRGIGAVLARHAAKEGYRVAAWDLDGEAVRAVADDIGEACVPMAVDVTDESSVRSAVAELPAAPSLVVNNAGIVRFGPLLELAAADWRAALDVNLTGTFLVARVAAERMIAESTGGAIVNIASINGLAAAPGAGAYTASKAGVVMLTEHMALEWGAHGIRVNAVAPGLIDAGMSDAIYADPEVRRLRSGRVPLGRLGTAQDVAETVLFLGSEKAAYVTGQTLAVDGGITRGALNAMPRARSDASAD
ncbi:NAD(P)-dependent dehydrogenase (short-subunit alcohol dehydrogenase family) [Actinomycetospora succinea]|uniref:NAD(P)-dependent dehydrogenase (Short-subunit alcohol dehydrogenase family) n=1 Tax=Actinomycetospora succinea TaxID=663603 RepID=A0A4R6V1D8_9PSEU|nr:SDR family NAD(P)-dependent oxidoreductase [Actinomycetospora succinea]TDQ51805.1 NAD(P)-dependent dehydrogenase (short-subunit alcohol dehydrogenase family) [Actinomycetospora succinea]